MVSLWRNMYRSRDNWGHRLRAAASMTSSTVPGSAAARMTPEDFLEELDTKRPDIDLGLGKSLELLARVGDPQNKLRVVHVAGTNGKGSVCAMIASMLRAAGKKVGVYNSPHLNHYSDAVLVNDRPDLQGWYDSMHTIQEALGGAEKACGKYTAFEVTCAAMWLQLERANVDYAVVEAGVGGLRDATNVCESVSGSVLTSVGLDHQELLGSTIPEIARDKVHGLGVARWAGRMEWASFQGSHVLLDGAHNAEAALALGAYVDSMRIQNQIPSVHWIIGMSAGKDVEGCVRALVRAGDHVECVAVSSLPRRHKAGQAHCKH